MTRNSSFKSAMIAAAFVALVAGHAAAQCTHTPAPIVISNAGGGPWTGSYTMVGGEGNTINQTVAGGMACSAGGANLREIVFEFTAPASGNFVFSTNNPATTLGGDPDTKLWVFSNCASPAATQVACSDDISVSNFLSSATGTLVGGTTYYAAVAGWSADANGQVVQLDITFAPPPPAHDVCATALAIASVPFSDGVDLANCNDEGFDTPASVAGGGIGGRDVFYTFTPAASGDYRLAAAGTGGSVDIGIGFYTGACGALVTVASEDTNAGDVLFTALTAGTPYVISTGGYNAAVTGNIITVLSGPVAATSSGGDDCATPIAVATVPFSDPAVDMSRNANWLNFGGVSYAGDRIYSFTAPSTDTFNFQISPLTASFDPMIIALNNDCVTLGVFPGSVGTQDLGGAGVPETLSFPMTAGQTAIVFFQDFAGFGGTADFNINAGAAVGDWSTY